MLNKHLSVPSKNVFHIEDTPYGLFNQLLKLLNVGHIVVECS